MDPPNIIDEREVHIHLENVRGESNQLKAKEAELLDKEDIKPPVPIVISDDDEISDFATGEKRKPTSPSSENGKENRRPADDKTFDIAISHFSEGIDDLKPNIEPCDRLSMALHLYKKTRDDRNWPDAKMPRYCRERVENGNQMPSTSGKFISFSISSNVLSLFRFS